MKKISLFVLLIASIVGCVFLSSQKAFSFWSVYEVTVASITLINGPARVQKMWVSSGTSHITQDWSMLVDSPTTNSVASLESFSRDVVKSPALIHPNTTYSGVSFPGMLDYGEDGVFFSSAVTVIRSTTSMGLAGRTYIKAKPGAF